MDWKDVKAELSYKDLYVQANKKAVLLEKELNQANKRISYYLSMIEKLQKNKRSKV